MNLREQLQREVQYRLACTVALWLLKGMCLGFGAFVIWRLGMLILGRMCHA